MVLSKNRHKNNENVITLRAWPETQNTCQPIPVPLGGYFKTEPKQTSAVPKVHVLVSEQRSAILHLPDLWAYMIKDTQLHTLSCKLCAWRQAQHHSPCSKMNTNNYTLLCRLKNNVRSNFKGQVYYTATTEYILYNYNNFYIIAYSVH